MFGIFHLIIYVFVKLSVLHDSDTPQNRRRSSSKRWEKHSEVKRDWKVEVGENYIRFSVLIYTRIRVGMSRLIESRMKWEGRVAYVGNFKRGRNFFMKNFRGISFVGSLGVGGKIILKYILTP
jgi:hypothetical protein